MGFMANRSEFKGIPPLATDMGRWTVLVAASLMEGRINPGVTGTMAVATLCPPGHRCCFCWGLASPHGLYLWQNILNNQNLMFITAEGCYKEIFYSILRYSVESNLNPTFFSSHSFSSHSSFGKRNQFTEMVMASEWSFHLWSIFQIVGNFLFSLLTTL